jgi:hypothetical protein
LDACKCSPKPELPPFTLAELVHDISRFNGTKNDFARFGIVVVIHWFLTIDYQKRDGHLSPPETSKAKRETTLDKAKDVLVPIDLIYSTVLAIGSSKNIGALGYGYSMGLLHRGDQKKAARLLRACVDVSQGRRHLSDDEAAARLY